MDNQEDKLLYSDITKEIKDACNYNAAIYRNSKLTIESKALHHRFRDDVCARLNQRGIYSITEKHFPKPLKEAFVKGYKICHFADVMVDSKILIEIKAGKDAYLYGADSVRMFQGQSLNTIEYAGLRLIILARISNDGEFNVERKRYIL